MTKHRKLVTKIADKSTKTLKFARAIRSFEAGKFKSWLSCANYYSLSYTTLHRLVDKSDDYKGSGRGSKVVEHIKWRAGSGCGVLPLNFKLSSRKYFSQLRLQIQTK